MTAVESSLTSWKKKCLDLKGIPSLLTLPKHLLNGIDRGCFCVVEIDDRIGKFLNTKFFKKPLGFINWNPSGSRKCPIK